MEKMGDRHLAWHLPHRLRPWKTQGKATREDERTQTPPGDQNQA